MKKQNILFVCKNNRFRSKIAEAYFNKINKNKNIKTESAGLFEGYPTNKRTAFIVKKLGITIKGKPMAMSDKLLNKQDLMIIVANDVPKSLFKTKFNKKIILWKIKDTSSVNEKAIIKITKKIIKKINKLNKGLN